MSVMKKYTNGDFTGTHRECCKYLNASLPRLHPENWPDGPWEEVPPPAPAPVPLEQAKHMAVEQVNEHYQQQAEQLIGKYPGFELQTWQDQEREALEYQQWNGTGEAPSTPVLTAIATARGITVSELAIRVIANATAWRQIAPQLAGQRQAIVDQIDAAETSDQIDAIIRQMLEG